MFVSRSSSGRGRTKGDFILVEVKADSKIDKPVIPAVLECIIQDVTNTRTRHEDENPNVAFVCIDRHPRTFEKLQRRCAIPSSRFIDGFSQCYPLRANKTGQAAHSGVGRSLVHIGVCKPCSKESGSLCEEIRKTLNCSTGRASVEEIVVIDSLTSVLQLHPGFVTFLDIRDTLVEEAARRDDQHVVTMICVFRSTEKEVALAGSLQRVADTHVVITQELDTKEGNRSSNQRDIVALKVCRRKASGRVQVDELTGMLDGDESRLLDICLRDNSKDGESAANKKVDEDELQQDLLGELGLSFRVSLSTTEREVRAAAGLPYLHQDEKLADTSLQLHPAELQLDGGSDSDGEEELYDSEGELFSEDV